MSGEPMFTSKSTRPPLRAHLSFQANVATVLLRTTELSTRVRARVVGRANSLIRGGAMLTSKSNRLPLRAHFSPLAAW
eukprot:8596264-Pyramimonas_sp.AAC.1